MNRLAILVALALALALPGCVTPDLATVTVDFSGQRSGSTQVFTEEIGFFDTDRPSRSFYDRDDVEHPGEYTAFDLIVEWADQEGHEVEATHDEQFGYFLASIDGLPEQGTTYFWALEVNGEASTVGMELVEIRDGDEVSWTLTDWDA